MVAEEIEQARRDENCELCVASRFTEWFHEDDDCWIAECESCSVPMVVWRTHSPTPSDAVKSTLHDRLRLVVEQHFLDEIYIDDHLRSIPGHYHAHARARGRWGTGLRRRGR